MWSLRCSPVPQGGGFRVDKHDKRDIGVTVKMSKADLEQFQKTAQTLWPGLILTRSTMLLSLARLGVQHVQAGEKTRKSS